MKYFDDLNVGDISRSSEHLVTREDIISMAGQYDPQPLHIDEEAAKKGFFGDIIACTAHLFCIMSMLSTKVPEEEKYAMVSGLGFDQGKLIKPVKPGDKLHIRLEITSLRKSKSKPMWGIVEVAHNLYNQDDEHVFSVTTSALININKPA